MNGEVDNGSAASPEKRKKKEEKEKTAIDPFEGSGFGPPERCTLFQFLQFEQA
jgi:hypothetical protein